MNQTITASTPHDERRRIIESLAHAGLLANAPALHPIPEEPISEEEEEELAQIFAGAKPLSEIIIEEHEEGGSNESNNFRNLR